MSRIGKNPITIPAGVDVSMSHGVITVKGAKGTLSQEIDSKISIEIADNTITLTRSSDHKDARSKHGLYRALINNMIVGVSAGWKKNLELIGVGYRAKTTGQQLEMTLGYSHPIVFELPSEVVVSAKAEKGENPTIMLESYDKQLIGQVAAKIRSLRAPEPYKGKGVRYVGEFVRKILKIFNVGPENYGALHDLIDVTDKILDAKKTPLMRLVEYGMPPLPSALPKNNAAPANLPADKVTELNKLQDIEIQAKKTLENFDKTKSVYEKAKQAQLFYTITHDPSKILPVLWGITKTIPAATLKRFLRAPTTDMIAGWGGHHITSILEVNKLRQQLGGTTKLHIANGVKVASQVSEIFRKNPELRSKIEKLALATTIDQINPSES